MYDYKEDLKKLVEDVKRKERERIVEILRKYEIAYHDPVMEILNG